jgi:nitrogen PTS system EIIA component
MADLDQVVLAVGLLEQGLDFAAVDEQPVRVVFCIVSPDGSPAAHLQCLAAISRWVKEDRHIEKLLELSDPQAIYRLLREEG